MATQTNGSTSVSSLNTSGTSGSALILEQFAVTCDGEFYPIAAVETTDAICIVDLGLYQIRSYLC